MKFCSVLIVFLNLFSAPNGIAQSSTPSNKLEPNKTVNTARLQKATPFGLSNELKFEKGENETIVTDKVESKQPITVTHNTTTSGQDKNENFQPVDSEAGTDLTNALKPSIPVVRSTETIVNQEEKDLEENLGEEYMGTLPRYFALIVGVSDYKYEDPGMPSLAYPVKDAKRFKQLLIDRYAFEQKNIRLLENPQRSAVIDAFEQLASEITEKDNLLIFYAGHGFYDKEKNFGYWLPSDARTSTKSDWITNTIVRDYMSAIPTKHTLLISDACFSGSIFKSRGVAGNMVKKISEMYKYPSRKAMTSGNLSQVPDRSFFTDYLIKRLSDNADPFLPSQTLFYRIYEPVTDNSPATPQFGVVQGTGDEGGDFIFIKREKKN
jgi:hypothetical protein